MSDGSGSSEGSGSPVSLSASSAVVLGLLASGGPQTTYDLKSYIEISIGFFWPFPSSQMYAETKRLEAVGLVEGEQEDFGRRRRLLRITMQGRAALDAWLAEPSERHTEIRDIGLLKLFLSEGAPNDLDRLIAEQISLHRVRLEEYESLSAAFGDSTSLALSTLDLGIAFEQVAIEFWEGIDANR